MLIRPSGQNIILFNQDTIDAVYHIARFDQNGNYIDVKRYPFKDYFNLPSIFSWDMDNEGNSYFIGSFQRNFLIVGNDTLFKDTSNAANVYVLAFDSLAQVKWTYKAGNYYDPAFDGMVFGDTVFAAVNLKTLGDTAHFGNVNYKTRAISSQDGVLLMLDANTGAVIGLRHSVGKFATEVNNFSIEANTNFMAVGGRFSREMTYSGSNDYMKSIDKSSSIINSDNFFALFDRQGNYLCEDMLYTLGAYDGITNFTFIDSSVIVAGFFNDTLFVAGDTLIARGKNDVFIARYDLPCNKKLPVGIKNNFIKAEKGVLVYPNPAKNFTNLIGKPLSKEANLIDINGKVVQSFQLDENLMQQQLHFKNHKAGVYFITIVGKGDKQVLKVVIE